MNSSNRFNGSRTTFSSDRVETGSTHSDHFDRGVRLNGCDGVTGVDRTLESVSAFDRDDLGDLVNVQLSGNAWQDVFAVGGGGGQDMAVNRLLLDHQAGDQRGDIFGKRVGVCSVVGYQHFAHASNFRRGFCHGANALTCNQNVHVAANFDSSGHGVQRGRGHCFAVVFSDYQDSHD
ncbi:hypothetical protein D9M70_176900 [compost metagenome]